MNHLAASTSPYLRQHADNPVDWYPWGEEALERARRERRPILLSIGYAACHWCHVMAHESFEDAATARLMNERFINIKVDREERPDIDSIYMQAVQAMTGHGGWPMTMFLTPEGVPFHAGTYYPPEDRHGLPSFRRVLTAVADAFDKTPERVEQAASNVLTFYRDGEGGPRAAGELTARTLDSAFRELSRHFDERHGGFGGEPKFPPTMALDFLLRYWRRRGAAAALDMVTRTFRAMARGGIYDQIGGGFARYSVDGRWLVPHFEKMLYDNALLVRLGVQLYQATKDSDVRRVVEDTIAWVAREMTSLEGGFHSSLDADSEGEEGKFYVWSAREFDEVLGADAPIARMYFGVSDEGNFEGHNIPHVPLEHAHVAARLGIAEGDVRAAVERVTRALFAARERRVRPGLDDKVLASWNGLMVRGIAEAAAAFNRPALREMALRGGEFLFREMVRDGRVLRTYARGLAHTTGFLEDQGAAALAALSLYELTFDRAWLDRARNVVARTVEWYWDESSGAFFDTAHDSERLVTRPRDVMDNAVPSGTSLAVDAMLRLAELTQDAELRRRATRALESLADSMAKHPNAFGHLLCAADMVVHGAVEIALIGDPSSEAMQALARTIAEHYVPARVVAGGNARAPADVALLRGRVAIAGRATAYVCRGYACDLPVTEALDLSAQLEHAGRGD